MLLCLSGPSRGKIKERIDKALYLDSGWLSSNTYGRSSSGNSSFKYVNMSAMALGRPKSLRERLRALLYSLLSNRTCKRDRLIKAPDWEKSLPTLCVILMSQSDTLSPNQSCVKLRNAFFYPRSQDYSSCLLLLHFGSNRSHFRPCKNMYHF